MVVLLDEMGSTPTGCRPRVCLSHFSELETGDKQAFDTHNQTPIQTRIQTRFSDVVFIGPFLVGGIKRLSLLLCAAAVRSLTPELELHWESKRLCVYRRVSSSSGDHRAIKSHKFVAFKSGRLNGYQNGFAFIEGDLVG